jgi:hypothetical protein
MFDSYIVVYKYLGDLMFYVTGSQDENELILYSVLQAFYESVSILMRWDGRGADRWAILLLMQAALMQAAVQDHHTRHPGASLQKMVLTGSQS